MRALIGVMGLDYGWIHAGDGKYTGVVIFDGDRKMRIRDPKMEPVKEELKDFQHYRYFSHF